MKASLALAAIVLAMFAVTPAAGAATEPDAIGRYGLLKPDPRTWGVVQPNPRFYAIGRFGLVKPNPRTFGAIQPNPRHWGLVQPNPRGWGSVKPNPRYFGVIQPNPVRWRALGPRMGVSGH